MAKVEVSKGKIKVVKDVSPKYNIRLILISSGAFFVFFVFILFPYMMKKNLINHLNIHPELLDLTPVEIIMVQSNKEFPSYLLQMGRLQMKIPINFIPTFIRPNSISFRTNPRKISRTLAIAYKNYIPSLDIRNTGAISLFLSNSLDEFLYQILHSTWHPVKLYCKANFLVDQGINSTIYKSEWDKYYHAYIFPTPGNTGFVARIFARDKSQYIEFSLFDETEPVKLQEWVDVAMTIKPGADYNNKSAYNKEDKNANLSLKDYIDMSNSTKNYIKIIQDCLRNYYSSYKVRWLIPIGIVMYEQGFYKELIRLCQFALLNVENPSEAEHWSDLYNKSINKVIKVDVIMNFDMKNIKIIVNNSSKFMVNKIRIRFTNTLVEEKSKGTYVVEIVKEGHILPDSEKEITLEMPAIISDAKGNENIAYKIESVNIID